MPTGEEKLAKAEQRLAEVEALEQSLQALREEVTRYHSLLGRKLEWLKQPNAADSPPAPVPQDIVSHLEASANQIYSETGGDLDFTEEEEVEDEGEEGEGGERRTSSRRKGNPIQLRITRLDNGELLEGWVVDRSTGGVRILLDQTIPIKTALSVRPVKAATNFPWIKAEVRSCKPERGGYSLGCMFLQKLTWGELQAFG